MNFGVFFSRNPVKLSCIFFGSGYNKLKYSLRPENTVVVSSRSEKA